MKNLSKTLLILIVSFSSATQAGPLVGGGGGGVHLAAEEKSVIVKVDEISDILLMNEDIISVDEFLSKYATKNSIQSIELSNQSSIKNVQLLDGSVLKAY